MILIFTIVFLMLSVRYIAKGQPFYDSLKEFQTADLKARQETNEYIQKELATEALGKIAGPLLWALTVIITELIYLTNAYDLDIYKWPTLAMIAWLLMGLIIGMTNKKKYVTEEDFRAAQYEIDTMPKRKIKNIIYAIISITYFCYILWILMGGN